MQTSGLFLHRNANPVPEIDLQGTFTRIGGDPHTVTRNAYESADGRQFMGVWESSEGLWRVNYNSWEFCHLLEGHCVITPDGGEAVELRAGDVFVVEPGFQGTWEVIEPIRKYYVFSIYPSATSPQ